MAKKGQKAISKPPIKQKYIETPERLWELFVGYKAETKNRPFLQHDFVGKDGESVRRERERCLTMVGFECYVMEHTNLSYPDLTSYFEDNEAYKTYRPISSRIRAEIKRDQVEGGMAMIYSQNLTARLNGLTDKAETEHKGNLNINADFGNAIQSPSKPSDNT